MQTVILNSNSKADLELLTKLAKKLGINVKYITEQEQEEIGLFKAIQEGRTGEIIDTDEFLKDLRK
ncbi:MAG: hypothetical protein R6U85_11430 [Salinivirgaceae bacterium]